MRAKLVFFAAAAAAAIGSAALAGLIVAVVGLCAHLPAATLITLIAGTAAATFTGVVALESIAASLFFNTPEPPPPNNSPPASTPTPENLARQQHSIVRPARKASPRSSRPAGPGS